MKYVFIALSLCAVSVSLAAVGSSAAIDPLVERYQRCTSDGERLQILINMIDEGLIRRGAPVEYLDKLFGSSYAQRLSAWEETGGFGSVFLSESRESARYFSMHDADEIAVQMAPERFGWNIIFAYDRNGAIRNYKLSNEWKSMSSYSDDKEVKPTTDEAVLKDFTKRYKNAKSETERLRVCVSAINRGAIAAHAAVANIDRIFGTNCVRHIPGHLEVTAHGKIDFGSMPYRGSKDARTPHWFMRFAYNHDGQIGSYYLSNVEAQKESELANDCSD